MRHALFGQPIRQFQQLLRFGAEGPRFLVCASFAAVTAHANHDGFLVNVQTCTTGVNDVHGSLSSRLALEDIVRMSNLLCVLSHAGRRQFRVRSDVRATLTLGLESTKYTTDLVQSRAAR